MKKKSTFLAMLAIMSIYFLQQGPNAISPALGTIFAVFGKQGYSLTVLLLISTLSQLTMIPATIFAGAVAGTKIKYKTLAVIGTLLFVVGGLSPAFATNYILILVERAIFGIGIGLIAPLAAALVQRAFEGDKQAKLLGLGMLVMNVGGICLTLIGGYLANFGWNYVFYVHAIGILSLILLIFFLSEPKTAENEETNNAEKEKIKVPGIVWIACIIFGLVWMFIFPLFLNTSTILTLRNLGNSTVAGVVISLFTVGGIIAGAIFGVFYKIFKRYIFGVSFLIFAAGYAFVVFGNSLIMIIAGSMLVGFAFSIVFPGVFVIIGMSANPSSFAMCNAILSASMGIFGFLSTYYVGFVAQFTGDGVIQPLFIGMISFAVLGLIFMIVNPMPKAKQKLPE